MLQARPELIRPEHIRIGAQGAEVFGEAAHVLQAFGTIEGVEHGLPRRRREYQQARLAEVMAHARAHSPFWAARIPRGKVDLARLPLLTRAALRSQVEAEGALPVPMDQGGVHENATSGSTSEPLRFFTTGTNAAYNAARYAFDDIASGRDISLPITVRDSKADRVEMRDRWPSLTGEVWRTGPARCIPVAGLSMEEIVALLLAEPPGHLAFAPAVVAALIDAAEAAGRPPGSVGEILTFGETVPPRLREDARRVLGMRIADRYSCEEIGPIAFQCWKDDRHYHVASSNVIVEAVDDSGRKVAEGAPGNLVLTALNATATPILRYNLGDIARLLPRCACGHAGPALIDLQGRRKSLLRRPDGQRILYYTRAPEMMRIAPLRAFRVVQPDRATLVLEVAADRALTDAERDALAALVRAETSEDFVVRTVEVERIDWGRGGKRIVVLNLTEPAPE